MMGCVLNAQTNAYLPKDLATLTTDFENDFFFFNYSTNTVNCKLLSINPYQSFFKQLYPSIINHYELDNDMLDVIHSYTDSQSNECYMKTNLNLLSALFDDIDWIYVNKLRSLIRGLSQTTQFKPIYYRGLTLSDDEIQYYLDRRNDYYYTTSFTSFTIDRLLIYPVNAVLMLRTDSCSEKARINLANIWQWSRFVDEKEALLAVGAKLKVLSVHFYGCKWEIEIELAEDDTT